MGRRVFLVQLAGMLPALGFASSATAGPPPTVDYNRDVRPILADHCFQCHGPDANQRKADLRLDTRDGLRAVDLAELLARLTSADPRQVMPPLKTGKPLTPTQITTLKAWIDQGAPWAAHWAFTVPVRPEVPVSRDRARRSWVRNPIDAFVMAQLERDGLVPSPEADAVTLIRRVTLDLTGLPPTPEEVDAFLKDSRPDAYEKLVDRLLASPRYGERMAWRWLEAARYADTNGYQTDAGRDMWRWRDWVIEAYNRNQPFDQFTLEQLAGDLLPHPTLDQRIATGFNRNHRGNSEGGIVPEEYAVEYVADRVETTATVWLGLTFTCARCHDHKYDPFPQKDFYRLFAFFNNVPEKGRAVKFGNSPPFIKAPTRQQQQQLAELDQRVEEAQRRVRELGEAIRMAQQQWEQSADPAKLPDWSPDHGLQALFKLNGVSTIEVPNIGHFGFDDRFSLACRIQPRQPDGTILARGVDEPRGEGYGVHLVGGKVQVQLTKRWLDDALRLETVEAVPLRRWSQITVTYDGSRLATGTKIYIDGVEAKTRVLLDELNQSFATQEPLRIGFGGGPSSRFDGQIDEVRIYDGVLEAEQVRVLAVAASVGEILRKPPRQRTAAEQEKLQAFFLEQAAPPEIRTAHEVLRTRREDRRKFWEAIPTVMVMEEMPTPRETHVLIRGEYDKKGERVLPGLPAALVSESGTNAPRSPHPRLLNRLDLARWIVSPTNPLTARVAVNHAWQLHFGTGLVKTPEDFGTQGAFPTHPELLDWLACEFRTDWDLKRLHKLIVTSATYRQSSRLTPELLARDPENRLLARFPRQRLSAEVIRDQALFVSGLLVEQLGGPSVKPYQPPGLWNELSGTGDYVPDTGANLYRRSLYTYWKRTAPPPVMTAFDAAGRETCWVRVSRTNTPLQALALLNETAFVEAARALAQRSLHETAKPDDRLARAFQRVTGRMPSAPELRVLLDSLEFHRAEFRRNPAAAHRLLAVGASKPDPKLDAIELAAYTTVCNMLLNLDEVVTRE